MSVKHALLALLTEQPQHGYGLKAEFERRTGGTWPLNIGQVYTTLQRLERDGLVSARQAQADGSVIYQTTADGFDEVEKWWGTTVDRSTPSRDELAIKLAVAVTVPGVDVSRIVQRQRVATLSWLQQLTRTKADPGRGDDLAWSLVVERMLFEAEAESRWLDHVEAAVLRAERRRPATVGTSGGSAATAGATAAGLDAVEVNR